MDKSMVLDTGKVSLMQFISHRYSQAGEGGHTMSGKGHTMELNLGTE